MFGFGDKLGKIAKLTASGKAAPMLKMLNDKDEKVRAAACEGLGKLRSNDAMMPLINLLHDSSATVRKAAALGLAGIGDAHAKEHINRAIPNEKDPEVLKAMREALMKIKNY